LQGKSKQSNKAHPDPTAALLLTMDASETTIGAVIEQKNKEGTQPLAFLSKKLIDAQKKYSPYDRELLAIYMAIKHFRHMLEGRHFVIYTDHKPLVYAFNKDQLQSSPRQTRHLELISQFSTDIRYITGKTNVVAVKSRRDKRSNQHGAVSKDTRTRRRTAKDTTRHTNRTKTKKDTNPRNENRNILRHENKDSTTICNTVI